MSAIRHRRTNDGSPQVFRAIRTSELDREDRRKDDRMNDDQLTNSDSPTTASRITSVTAIERLSYRSMSNPSTNMNKKGRSRVTFCMVLSRLTIGLLIVLALSPPLYYRSFVNLEIPQPRVFGENSTQRQQVAVLDLCGTTQLRTKAPMMPTYSEEWLAMFEEEIQAGENFYKSDILRTSSYVPFFGPESVDAMRSGHKVEKAIEKEFFAFRVSNTTPFHLYTVGDLRKARRILRGLSPDPHYLNRSIEAFEWLSLHLRNSTAAIHEIRDLNEYVRMEVWNIAKAAIPFCFLTSTAPAYKQIFDAYRCSYSYVFEFSQGENLLNHDLLRIEFDIYFCHRIRWNDVMLEWMNSQASTLTEVSKRGSDRGIWDLLLSRKPGM